ncbi:MAG: (Fe-S)-binding protein [Bacillaceae bacterium]|nr:(Fe-S)-binding protein [Bacillaceae bacterium]
MGTSHRETRQLSTSNSLYEMVYDEVNRCIQCGYCLPACPTYESMEKESASPRGRINLVKMAAEGKIDVTEHMKEPIDQCLGCRACEVACPVNLDYGHILESAREAIREEHKKRNRGISFKEFFFSQLFPHSRRLRAAGNLVWAYQKSSLNKIMRKTKRINRILEPMVQMEKALPLVDAPVKRVKPGSVIPAKGETKARVAFFTGCISDAVLHRTNRLTVELLSLVGCEVIIPERQNCCGALHAHQGLKKNARDLAKKNIAAFEHTGADYYVNNAGGCGAMMIEYDKLLKDDPEWNDRAQHFSSKMKDISILLTKFGPLPFQKKWEGVITYQDSCHLRNVQGIHEEPRILLKSIPGATYVELSGSDRCCASGGIYNLLQFDESMKILDQKMGNVKETKAATIVTTNPGCLLQMRLGIERCGQSHVMQGVHLVDVLAEACGVG